MLLFFLLSPTSGHSAEQLYEQMVGEATGLQSGQSLYEEVHCGAVNELASDVYYQSSDGALIAHKTLDYGSGRSTHHLFRLMLRIRRRLRSSSIRAA